MGPFLQNFDAIWEARKWEMQLGLSHFESFDFEGKSLAEIGQFMTDARTFHRRAWEIHFEIMYPLLGIYLQMYGLCASNGIDPGQVAKFFQGRDSMIMENDRAMWGLVAEAQRLGIVELFDTEPEQIRGRLAKAGATRRCGSRSSTTSCRSTDGAPRASPTPTSRRGSRTPRHRSGRSATSCRWTNLTTSRRQPAALAS